MFHRQDIHAVLKETAVMEEGEGTPAKLVFNHRAKAIDCEAGKVTFENGVTIEADMIIGADGIRVSIAPSDCSIVATTEMTMSRVSHVPRLVSSQT